MAQLGRRAKQRRNMQIAVISLLVLVTLAALAGGAYFMWSRPAGLDARMCPPSGPTGHFVLLVDTTDPLTFTQGQAYSTIVNELIEKRTPEGHLLSVFLLGEDFKSTAAPVVELCNPGTGADKSELTANTRKLRRQYEERFLRPLLDATKDMVAKKSGKASPVLEMLQLVGLNGFRKADVKGVRRLIVISDMLHNTPQFSMYRDLPEHKAFASTPYGQRTQAELRDVEVELHYLINSPKLQTRQNLSFWESYFNKAGARIVAVRPMEG